MTNLPRSWASAPLGSIAARVTKGTTPTTNGFSFLPAGVNFIRIENLHEGRIALDTVQQFISLEAHNAQSRSALHQGDILFSIAGTIGEIAIVEEKHLPANTNQALAIISGFDDTLEPRFLEFQLKSLSSRETIARARGGAMNNISLGDLREMQVVVAPRNEQRRLVAKLEELFSELDKGIDNLVRARQQLDLYRLVVLHQALLADNGKPFPAKPLRDLIGEIGQGWSPKCDVNTPPQDSQWAIIKTTAVQPMSYVAHECKPLPAALQPRSSIEIRDGDLLMTRKGPRPRTGVVCYVKKARPHSMLCDTVYRFRAREHLVLPQYLEIALNAPTLTQEINARKSGISESGISLNHGKLHTLPIPVPPDLSLQARIVDRVWERMSVIEHQCDEVGEQILRTESLRQAILKRAFSGELVAQDSSDEPASELLKRTRTASERSSTAKQRNIKKEAA